MDASVNVTPLSVYSFFRVGPLHEIGVINQLADGSIVYPEGVLEDALVQVYKLAFLNDLYVLDMKDDDFLYLTQIFLGRPFIKHLERKLMCIMVYLLWNSKVI